MLKGVVDTLGSWCREDEEEFSGTLDVERDRKRPQIVAENGFYDERESNRKWARRETDKYLEPTMIHDSERVVDKRSAWIRTYDVLARLYDDKLESFPGLREKKDVLLRSIPKPKAQKSSFKPSASMFPREEPENRESLKRSSDQIITETPVAWPTPAFIIVPVKAGTQTCEQYDGRWSSGLPLPKQ